MTTDTLHIDFESRSRVNLLIAGAYVYASDPSTSVICMAYAFNDGPVMLWAPDEPFPEAVTEYIRSGGTIVAHNAQFERLLFWYVICPDFDVPEPTLEQFQCSAAQCRTNGLPGALEDAPRALGLRVKKDPRGRELIKLLCIPEGAASTSKEPYFSDGQFCMDPELLEEMYDYCRQDVRVERDLLKYIRPLTLLEWEEFWASEKSNDRGIEVDVELCKAALAYADAEVGNLNRRMASITGIDKARSTKVTLWVYDRLDEKTQPVMERGDKLSLDAQAVEDLLVCELTPEVREALVLRAAISASSVAKFRTMLNRADPEDHRVRGSFMFAGAPTSGRFSARGLQLHNYPRDCAEDPEAVRAQIIGREAKLVEVMSTLSSMLRPTLMGRLVWSDWSAIEARALPWLSGDPRAEEVLGVFRACDADPELDDIYVRAASQFGGTRQQGKVAVLSLGYGGSVGAFQAMASGYGVRLPDAEVKLIVDGWRRVNPWATSFWNDLHTAAVRAFVDKGEWQPVGRVGYCFDETVMGGTLYCQLPSGRLLGYPHARRELVENQYGTQWEISALKASRKPAAGAPEWPRFRLWRGLLAENITQATCADLLRDCLVVCEDAGLSVLGHVHDEIIIEGDKNAQSELRQIMEHGPDWAVGLPLAAETKYGNRYSK